MKAKHFLWLKLSTDKVLLLIMRLFYLTPPPKSWRVVADIDLSSIGSAL